MQYCLTFSKTNEGNFKESVLVAERKRGNRANRANRGIE